MRGLACYMYPRSLISVSVDYSLTWKFISFSKICYLQNLDILALVGDPLSKSPEDKFARDEVKLTSADADESKTRRYTIVGTSSSSSAVRVVIFSDCRLPCVKTVMPDKTGKIPQIPG